MFSLLKPRVTGLLLTLLLFAGCASKGPLEPGTNDPVQHTGDTPPRTNPDPKRESFSRDGNAPSYIVNGKRYYTLPTGNGYEKEGLAYWYEAKKTFSGKPFDRYAMTAAHRTLPLSTYVQVTNLSNNRSVIVKVNDRGPFNKGLLIDLSYAAAAKLGMLGHGTTEVEVRSINSGGNSKDSDRDTGFEAGNQPTQTRSAAVPATGRDKLDLGTLEPPEAGVPREQMRNAESRQPVLPVESPAPTETSSVASPAVATQQAVASPGQKSTTDAAQQTPATATNNVSKVFLQVGTFLDRDNALRLQQRIREQFTEKVKIVEKPSRKGIFYKVRVGPLDSLADADRTSLELKPLGVDGAFSIVYQ